MYVLVTPHGEKTIDLCSIGIPMPAHQDPIHYARGKRRRRRVTGPLATRMRDSLTLLFEAAGFGIMLAIFLMAVCTLP